MNEEATTSTPSIFDFDPVIPYQLQLIKDVRKNYDYSLGAHEILLSGSIGCLREDALISTACGEVPICDITRQHHILSFDHYLGRFVFQSNSGAFLKDKGSLYRVISERGEFVASAHHRIATSQGNYVSVLDAISSFRNGESFLSPEPTNPSFSRLSSISDALNSMKTISSFLCHCVKRIHQCDPQLLPDLEIALNAFPLLDDALKFDQVSYCHTPEHEDDLLALTLKYDRIFELCAQTKKKDSLFQQERPISILEDLDNGSIPLRQILDDIQLFQQHRLHNCHPNTLLLILSKLGIVLLNALKPYPVSYTNCTIKGIEKVSSDQWYWDIQVPNTNNYVCAGMVHHNSAKSTVAAHLALTHCLMFTKAKVLIGRRSLPDAKRTIYQKIIEHIGYDLKEGIDYSVNSVRGSISFKNGSEIISGSWADKRYMKFRSLDLSAAVFEEIVENSGDDIQAYKEIKMRIGRLPHIKENWILSCTNPGSPMSYWYKYFMKTPTPTRHVIYSRTDENPFLPPQYIEQLKSEMDPMEARRMIYGEWIDLGEEVVYHNYKSDRNYIDKDYEINPNYPVDISHDFNIGESKPMSACLSQYINGVFHFFRTVIVDGARTSDIMEEIDPAQYKKIRVFGDASGSSRNTRSIKSDYDLIREYLSNSNPKVEFEMKVPLANPAVRERHNLVNAMCYNANKEIKLFVYRGAQSLDEGFRLTKLKKGGNYIEDDSFRFQHVTTASGYMVRYLLKNNQPIKESYRR